MEILPQNTYTMLKSISKKELTKDEIVNRYGKTAEVRMTALIERHFIQLSSQVDRWGKPIEKPKYAITISGLCYLEDHKSYVSDERWRVLKYSIIVPILVSVTSSLLINGISLWLQWK